MGQRTREFLGQTGLHAVSMHAHMCGDVAVTEGPGLAYFIHMILLCEGHHRNRLIHHLLSNVYTDNTILLIVRELKLKLCNVYFDSTSVQKSIIYSSCR